MGMSETVRIGNLEPIYPFCVYMIIWNTNRLFTCAFLRMSNTVWEIYLDLNYEKHIDIHSVPVLVYTFTVINLLVYRSCAFNFKVALYLLNPLVGELNALIDVTKPIIGNHYFMTFNYNLIIYN